MGETASPCLRVVVRDNGGTPETCFRRERYNTRGLSPRGCLVLTPVSVPAGSRKDGAEGEANSISVYAASCVDNKNNRVRELEWKDSSSLVIRLRAF